MVYSRRALNDPQPLGGPSRDDAGWARDGWDARPDGELDEIASAAAAEIEAAYASHHATLDPMQPVDLETGRIHGAADVYDQWDDEALDRLAEELSQFEEFDPQDSGYGVLPPHAADEAAAAPRERAGFGPLFVGVSLAALVIAGGAGWYFLSGTGIGGFGDPVHVAAPADPFKIVPQAGDTIDEPVDAVAVFDPANGGQAKGEERLVAREEEIPDLPGVTPQVNRVILPDGQEIDAEPAEPVESGPRRVRTVLVRPDGSIIDAPDAAPRQAPPLTAPTLATDTPTIADAIAAAESGSAAGLPPLPASELTEGEASDTVASLQPLPPDVGTPDLPAAAPAAPPAEVALAPAAPETAPILDNGLPFPGDAPAAPQATAPAAAEQSAAPVAEDIPPPVVDAPVPPPRPAPPVEVAAAPPAAAAAPAQPADGPLDLMNQVSAAPAAAPAAPAAAAAPPAATTAAAPAGSAFVQLSSQRSEEAALQAFRGLQGRHPDILGGLAPDVQRADLGDRGIYYRVRVAQPSRADAAGLCERLRAAGSDCLLANR